MVLPLLALGLAAGGAGASWYGGQQKEKALRDALAKYQAGMQQLQGEEAAGSLDTQRQFGDLTDQRFTDMSGALNKFFAAPTGRSPEDSATITGALDIARGGAPAAPVGGAAGGWATQVGEKNLGAINGLVDTASDAGVTRRNTIARKRALGDFSITDTRRGAQGQQIGQLDQLRRMLLQRRMAKLQNESQGTFDQAGRAGDDWLTAGSLMGLGGSAVGSRSTSAGPSYTQYGNQWYQD